MMTSLTLCSPTPYAIAKCFCKLGVKVYQFRLLAFSATQH